MHQWNGATAETPTGYLADLGATFGDRGNGYSYGWDLENATSARNRNSANSPDERYDTLTQLQLAQPSGSRWEIELPLTSGPTAVNNKIAFVDIASLPQVEPEPPRISTERQGAQLVLNWTGNSSLYTVQRKGALNDAEWIDVITTPERTAQVPIELNSGFFRVQAQ